MTELLQVEHVSKVFKNGNQLTAALNDITFTMKEGEFVGIMGPSGSGKTTLLNAISTIDTIDQGRILLKGSPLSGLGEEQVNQYRKKDLGFIFQHFNLIDSLTAFDNIALALSINQVPYKEIQERVAIIMKKLEIEQLKDKYPHEVSGGQRQRIAAARAVITEPSLLLADEPTGALDSKSSVGLLNVMKKLNKEQHTTIVMVTHDAFSASYCHRILFIKDGKIYHELVKGDASRKEFFDQVMNVQSTLGGGSYYADY